MQLEKKISVVATPTKVSPPTGKDASKNTKEIGGDAQQKGEGKPDKMQKPKPAGVNKPLAMSYDSSQTYTDDN